ncbi:RTA1-domain-containing protein [Atractiella rhizophila]|nr:RTA1-domain-containing protein [Atractiella rhizophila]
MSNLTILSPGEYSQLPKSQREAYCNRLDDLKLWKKDDYDGREDPCNQYGYVPSIGLGAAFLALFVLLTFIHAILVVGWKKKWNRFWTMLTLTAGGILEVVGWVSRVLAYDAPYDDGPFIAQVTTLIIAPVFFSAALYLLVGFIIVELGAEHSILKPKFYGAIFITCDFISLVLQGAGGGLAATANTQDQRDTGTNIMEAGIVFQLVATIIFSVFAMDFRRRASKAGVLPPRYSALYYLEISIATGTAMVIIRGIYRTVELAQGWNGYLIEHEMYILLDAFPMLVLLVALALAHPFWTFHQTKPKKADPEKLDSTQSSHLELKLVKVVAIATVLGAKQEKGDTIGAAQQRQPEGIP